MTILQIAEIGILINVIALLLSAAVAFGVVKGKMKNYLTHGQYREACHDKSTETNTILRELREDIKQLISETGILKGKIGD